MKYKLPFLILIWLSFGVSILFAGTLRIMPLGDSITNGITDGKLKNNTRPGYRAPLWRKLKSANYAVDFVGSLKTGSSIKPTFDIDNEGHSGWTSYEIAEKLNKYLSYAQPNIILLHIGTNDRRTSVSGVKSILNEIDIYEKQSGRKIRVIVALIINRRIYDPVIAGFNKKLKKLVMDRWENGDILTLVDMNKGAALHRSDYANNTHPNNTGYAKMANVWFNELKKPYVAYTSAPYAKDDKVKGETGHPVSINVTSNDVDRQNDMAVNTVSFVQGKDTDKDGDNNKLSTSEGTWKVDETGLVTFTPKSHFTGDPTPIKYTVKDKEGKASNIATISIDYSNTSLNNFPTSLVDSSYIESTQVNESANSIEFITRIPDTGITF